MVIGGENPRERGQVAPSCQKTLVKCSELLKTIKHHGWKKGNYSKHPCKLGRPQYSRHHECIGVQTVNYVMGSAVIVTVQCHDHDRKDRYIRERETTIVVYDTEIRCGCCFDRLRMSKLEREESDTRLLEIARRHIHGYLIRDRRHIRGFFNYLCGYY
jgi:hypothetical protein